MADETDVDSMEGTTVPSSDQSVGATAGENEEVYELHEEIDNLNLVLDHLERKNGDIYSRIEQLLASFQRTDTEHE